MFTILRGSQALLPAPPFSHVNIVEIGGALASITITDINSEISDADNATNSIKFKYKYSSHHFPINIDYGKNIFDDSFYRTFD